MHYAILAEIEELIGVGHLMRFEGNGIGYRPRADWHVKLHPSARHPDLADCFHVKNELLDISVYYEFRQDLRLNYLTPTLASTRHTYYEDRYRREHRFQLREYDALATDFLQRLQPITLTSSRDARLRIQRRAADAGDRATITEDRGALLESLNALLRSSERFDLPNLMLEGGGTLDIRPTDTRVSRFDFMRVDRGSLARVRDAVDSKKRKREQEKQEDAAPVARDGVLGPRSPPPVGKKMRLQGPGGHATFDDAGPPDGDSSVGKVV